MKLKIANMITEEKIRESSYIEATFPSALLSSFQVMSALDESKKLAPSHEGYHKMYMDKAFSARMKKGEHNGYLAETYKLF